MKYFDDGISKAIFTSKFIEYRQVLLNPQIPEASMQYFIYPQILLTKGGFLSVMFRMYDTDKNGYLDQVDIMIMNTAVMVNLLLPP